MPTQPSTASTQKKPRATVAAAPSLCNVGVVGYGYWGPNIVRNFNLADGARVTRVCDRNPAVLASLRKGLLDLKVGDDPVEVVEAPDVDVVAIVTPVSTHFELARAALENGKHVFVEKPFTATVAEGEELVELAARKNLQIMVDHTFLFTGAVRKIKELITSGSLGEVFYYDSTRVNLGKFQSDVNVVWDLAPHDFSIMHYLLDEEPTSLSATGQAHINKFEDLAYITVNFASNLIAHFSVNWLSPVKVRNTMIGGEKQMLVWDDVKPDEKIKVYDKGIWVDSRESMHKLRVSYRSGDMFAPKIDSNEALKVECGHFLDCIDKGTKPINSGEEGLEVVKMLAACDLSMRHNGKTVAI